MSKFYLSCSWDEIPHLDESAKRELWESIPPYLRDARSKGIPQLGSGAIYPLPESLILVDDFQLPTHWPKGWALDAQPLLKSHVAGALDRESQTLYIYSVFKRERVEPTLHAECIRALGPWLPGVGDASGLVADSDRTRYIDIYKKLNLDIQLAQKGVESGIEKVYQMMSQGRLKVFASCRSWFEEFRMYRRDDKGRIVKKNDHLMDCTRYLVASGIGRMKTKPVDQIQGLGYMETDFRSTGWMM